MHKNFEIVPDVLAALKKQAPERRFVFTLTAPESGNEWKNIKERAEVLGVGGWCADGREGGTDGLPETVLR